MKITKGKIILAVIVINFIVFAVINVNKEKDTNELILDTVTYVTDGKVNPDNEGKLVIVSGKVGYDSLVTFMELDENFGSVKISRKVEDYLKVESDDEEEEDSYEWVEREEPLSDANGDYLKTIVSEERVSTSVKVGEFDLDKQGIKDLPLDYYAKQEQVGDLITTGIDYSRDPHEENLKVGDMKITYKYFNLEKNPYVSVLAVQKGNSFEPYKVDKKNEVYQVFMGKVENKEALTKELKTNVKRTIRGKSLFIIMILGIGIFFIVDNRKKK